jgi:hypothetical protein
MYRRAKSQAMPKAIGSVARGLALSLPYIRRPTNGVSVRPPKEQKRRMRIRSCQRTGNTSATANAEGTPRHRTVVHRVYTYEPAPSASYRGVYYAPAAPIAALPSAAV